MSYCAVLFYQKSGVAKDKALAMKMAAIAAAESSCDPKAKGGPNSNGTYDHGLWQINDGAWPDLVKGKDIYSPIYNAYAAGIVYKKQGLSAWSTYGGENYRKNLEAVRSLMVGQSWDELGSSKDYLKFISSGVSAVPDVARGSDAANPVDSIGKAIGSVWDLTPVANFFKMQIAVVGVFALAMLLIVLGLYLLVKPALPPISVNPLPIKTK